MVLARKELLLVIVIRAPRQHACNIDVLPQNLAHHILRLHAFGRVHVVRAASAVDMMVARIPPELGWIDPALELEGQLAWSGRRGGEFTRPRQILGTTRILHRIVILRKLYRLSI